MRNRGGGKPHQNFVGTAHKKASKGGKQKEKKKHMGGPHPAAAAARRPPPPAAAAAPPAATAALRAGGGGGPGLLAAMRARLAGGAFRHLNERLYSSTAAGAAALLAAQPELYDQYHAGFREQTRGWPELPVARAAAWLAARPASWTVADVGAGDAALAAAARQRVLSFDLVARAPGVVAANGAALPLGAAAVDAVVVCLALMGTDYWRTLAEAARVLRARGWLWVAEVASRFVRPADGGSALGEFCAAVQRLGFAAPRRDESNPYFVVLEFQRLDGGGGKGGGGGGGGATGPKGWPELRVCAYKKR